MASSLPARRGLGTRVAILALGTASGLAFGHAVAGAADIGVVTVSPSRPTTNDDVILVGSGHAPFSLSCVVFSSTLSWSGNEAEFVISMSQLIAGVNCGQNPPPPPFPWAYERSLGHLTEGHYRVVSTLDQFGVPHALPAIEFDVQAAPLDIPFLSHVGLAVFAVALILVAVVRVQSS